MIPLTDKGNKSYKKQKACCICKKEFSIDENDKNTFKLYRKRRDHFITREDLEEPHIAFVI